MIQQQILLLVIICAGFISSFAATLTVTKGNDSGYSMDVNGYGQTDKDGVCLQLSIIVHPAPQYSCGGGSVSFAVTATDATDYLWQRSSDNGDNWVPLNDGDYGLISGAGTDMLTAAGASLSDIGGTLFRCQVSADAEILFSNPALFTLGTPALTIGYGSTGFCSDAAPVEVITNGYLGGLYSAEPAGLSLNTATGQIDPAASALGTYTVTYTLAAQNDCPAISTTTEVNILDSGTASLWYADADGDGFGDAAVSLLDCGQPNGYVADNTDCDDANDAIYPGAFELCNGIDDDCDGNVDDNCCPDTDTIWYVAADAATVGNGASWNCAFQNLQDAINAASAGHEIWVKAGTYKPTQDPFGNTNPANPRNKTFYLKDGVAMYGGFAGTEIMRNLRDWATHVTTLSGDFNDDDDEATDPLILINNTENAFHVLLSISDAESTILDGFMVKSGNANDESTRLIIEGYESVNSFGGGMGIINSSITIDNTIFTNNEAYYGGGMYISFSNPSIRQSTFNRNTAARLGGGVFNNNVSLKLTDAVFRENYTDISGGGMYSEYSNLTMSNVLFTSNAATSGAGMANFRGNSNISNTVFSHNLASSGNGGGISNVRENMIITNARFSGNSAFIGGGISQRDSLIQLIHCTFSGNNAQYLATALYLNSSESILKNCLVWNNRFDGTTGSADASLFSPFPVDITYSLIQAWNPAGTGNLDGITYAADSNYPQFVTPLDPATAPSTGGDFHLQDCSPVANVGDNTGAPATDLEGNPRIFNTTVDIGAYERQTYSTAPAIWYADADGDTFGNPAVPVASCTQPAGYAGNNTDCNDLNNLEKPGQIWFKDTDNDGYGQTGAPTITQCLRPVGYKAAIELISPTGDCNDNNTAINPAASEVCDGIDNDCDGTTDGVSILPCGWNAETNGVNCNYGNNVSYNSNTQIFTATSTNCYYPNSFTSDALAFAQYDLCGNGSVTAQVTSITGGLGWAGVTMRENNASGAKKAQLMTNLSAFSRREFRTTTGAAAYPQQFPSQNRYWLRITRTGNQFAMYISQNGTSWFFNGSQTIVMGNCIEMGLVVTNYNVNSTVTATFANVSVTGGFPLRPSIQIEEDKFAVADFSIMPNPINGWTNIELGSYGRRDVKMDIYSLQGKLLRSAVINAAKGSEEIDLSTFTNGMYLIRVTAEGLPDVTKRVVVNSNR